MLTASLWDTLFPPTESRHDAFICSLASSLFNQRRPEAPSPFQDVPITRPASGNHHMGEKEDAFQHVKALGGALGLDAGKRTGIARPAIHVRGTHVVNGARGNARRRKTVAR